MKSQCRDVSWKESSGFLMKLTSNLAWINGNIVPMFLDETSDRVSRASEGVHGIPSAGTGALLRQFNRASEVNQMP